MVNFFFGSVNWLLVELRLLVSLSSNNMEVEQNDINGLLAEHPLSKTAIEEALQLVGTCSETATKLFEDLKSPHIDDAVRRFRYLLDNGNFKWSELNTRSRALRDTINTELRQYLYFQYSRQKGDKLRVWESDWRAVLNAFPDIVTDVFSATDCYALEHNTASVFHSMRIAEHGLRSLAKERNVKLPKEKLIEWATWQEIIRALEDEIKIIGSKKAGEARDNALAFYSGARADLNGFKDEYRNLVMHVRANYDEFQALRALTNVHAFMVRLAAKIDRTHQPINWGFIE